MSHYYVLAHRFAAALSDGYADGEFEDGIVDLDELDPAEREWLTRHATQLGLAEPATEEIE